MGVQASLLFVDLHFLIQWVIKDYGVIQPKKKLQVPQNTIPTLAFVLI
jgi:hypothetical protein